MKKLEELEKRCKELGEEIERLKNEGKRWKPKNRETYYCVGTNSTIQTYTWSGVSYDERIYDFGNCFKTEEEAEAVAEKIKIYQELKRLAEEINTEPIDWDNEEQDKYYICYKHKNRYMSMRLGMQMCTISSQQDIGLIYSTNRDFLKIAKERIGEDRLLKLFKE